MEPRHHDAFSNATSSNKRPPLKRSNTASKKKLLRVYHVILKRGSTTDYIVGMVSHVGAAITALAELGNDVASIGHGHGMLLLVASRLARECNGIRSAVVEELEELAHVKLHRTVSQDSNNEEVEEESWWWKCVMNTCGMIGSILSTQNVASLLALASLASAALEVIEDAKPGGHHGAVLLAMNELWELMELSDIVPISWRRVLFQQHLLRLCLVTGALVVAIMEVYEDLFPSSNNTTADTNSMGAHHGVTIFAISKILGVIALMRTEVREIEKEEEAMMMMMMTPSSSSQRN
jgi:hypothetical protein